MRLLLIITTNDVESVWNALRLANTSVECGNQVDIFLLGKGVEATCVRTREHDTQEQLNKFIENNGNLIGCGVCIESRKETMPFLLEVLNCEVGSMKILNSLITQADKVLTF